MHEMLINAQSFTPVRSEMHRSDFQPCSRRLNQTSLARLTSPKSMKRRTTCVKMADVATAAGVHQTTVSRALRGDRALPLETRRRLTELAEKMGYRRNPLVSALIAERKRGAKPGEGVVLAVLSAGATSDYWRRGSPTYNLLYHHMQDQATDLGYRLEEFALEDPKLHSGRLRRILINRGIRGVIVPPMPIEAHSIEFDFDDFASVALRYGLSHPAFDRVMPDYFSAMATAMEKLIATGHRRIAFITDAVVDERVYHRSLGAFFMARQSRPRWCLPPKIVERWCAEDFSAWVKNARPDAIIAPTYNNWSWVRQQLQAGGWKLPRDLSLASLGCLTDSKEAGIAHNLELEASTVIKLLARKVECAEFGIPAQALRISVPGDWKDGELFAPRTTNAARSV